MDSNPCPLNYQQWLIGQIINVEQEGTDQQGLAVYRRNLLAAASRALSVSFPTLQLLVGASVFGVLARGYLHACGRDVFEWGRWGEQFPEWLEKQPLIHDYPYLADCARLDWYVHCANRASDPIPDYDSFGALHHREDFHFSLVFPSETHTIESIFPIVSIYLAHKKNCEKPDLNEAGRMLRKRVGQTALIWRQGLYTHVRVVPEAEQPWLPLLTGETVDQRLNDPATDNAMPFQDWIDLAIQSQLVIGLHDSQHPLR